MVSVVNRTYGLIITINLTMKEQGIVVETSGGTAKIRLTQKPECTRCGLCTGASGGFQILTVKARRPLQINEVVTLEINQKLLTLSSVLLYGLPLSGFIIGAVIGYIIGKEVLATIMAVGLMVTDLVVVKIIIRKFHLEEKTTEVL